MDARICRAAVLVAAIGCLGASERTANFIVTAPTPQQAREIAAAAEKYRHDLAVEWLGQAMPNWGQPCPINAQVAENLGAGGATSFLFDHGEVFGWRMNIQGSHERILDSVLPHEVTHTIFATHFRRPLPRWADEGACTTVEHPSEKTKQQVMLVDFLRTNRGIAFSRMFAMKDYPQDVMPLYSEGYSLARFLLAQGGKQKFLAYLADGMRDENWQRATKACYGFDNLAVLQDTWLDWVRRGSPALQQPKPTPGKPAPSLLAENSQRERPEPNLIYRAQSGDELVTVESSGYPSATQPRNSAAANRRGGAKTAPASDGWHASADDAAGQADVETAQQSGTYGKSGRMPHADEQSNSAADGAPSSHEVTRPQPGEGQRQVILEWTKNSRGADQPAVPAATDVSQAGGLPFRR